VLLEHLLKLGWSPDHNPILGWRRTVREQRSRLKGILDDSPSLGGYPAAHLDTAYRRARANAQDDPSLGPLPAACPFTPSQILDEAFWPGAAGSDPGGCSP
jgi:hypothetical protein